MAFIDDMRSAGHAVESTCAVLSEQGCRVAARRVVSWRRVAVDGCVLVADGMPNRVPGVGCAGSCRPRTSQGRLARSWGPL
jgi:hypothetical protein